MTLSVSFGTAYRKKCEEEGARFYQYSQYCELYNKWCEENYETVHFDAVIAQKMEVDFAGQTFSMTDPLTGEIMAIVRICSYPSLFTVYLCRRNALNEGTTVD